MFDWFFSWLFPTEEQKIESQIKFNREMIDQAIRLAEIPRADREEEAGLREEIDNIKQVIELETEPDIKSAHLESLSDKQKELSQCLIRTAAFNQNIAPANKAIKMMKKLDPSSPAYKDCEIFGSIEEIYRQVGWHA